jgi:hypothetical protein
MTKNSFVKTLLLASCAPAFLLGATIGSLAQSIPQSGVQPPSDLPDEYAPKGLPLGAFRLFPTLDAAMNYDDNVYKVDVNKKGDLFWELSPRAALQSQWSQHYLVLRAGGTGYVYDSLTHENRIDWDLDGEGRIDIQRGYAIYGGASYRHTYEPRSSPDQQILGGNQQNFAFKSTPFNVAHADARLEAKPEDLGVIVGVNFDRYQYDSTQICPIGTFENCLAPLTNFSNKDRNYDGIDAYVRALYEFSPGYSVFGHFAYVTRDFDTALDRNGVNRDSTGYRANAGLSMELTRLITGEFYAGYLEQNYKAPLGRDGGFNFGADIKWIPTPLLTVRLGASHLINETVVAYGPNIATDSNEERLALGVDYSVRRNIVLHVDGAYLRDKFTGAGRLDELALFGFGATYLMNEYIHVDMRYILNSRNSNKAGQDFEDNVFRLGLGLQL